VAKVYGELERAGVLATRRGVGTFVLAAEASVGPPAVRARKLAGLADRFLIEAASLGFTADEAVDHLKLRVQEKGSSDA
jgi:DNA-binding transcriptional regulator YhcF (GntR family)